MLSLWYSCMCTRAASCWPSLPLGVSLSLALKSKMLTKSLPETEAINLIFPTESSITTRYSRNRSTKQQDTFINMCHKCRYDCLFAGFYKKIATPVCQQWADGSYQQAVHILLHRKANPGCRLTGIQHGTCTLCNLMTITDFYRLYWRLQCVQGEVRLFSRVYFATCFLAGLKLFSMAFPGCWKVANNTHS